MFLKTHLVLSLTWRRKERNGERQRYRDRHGGIDIKLKEIQSKLVRGSGRKESEKGEKEYENRLQ